MSATVTREQIEEAKRRFGIIGRSEALNRAIAKALQVAPTDLTVLLYGESGVGKELFARLIHNYHPRRKYKPFVAVNCAAIPEGTMDSELFGHERGAFTGAYESRKGYFEYADKGSIFLDEVSEMPMETQAKLLRVLETGEFMRVGSSEIRKTDVRVIAATNKNLQELVVQGKFREDLYYRINTVPINIPPLRERGEDVLLLFEKFTIDTAEKYGCEPLKLTDAAKEFILKYPWPGNIRQLKHVVEQLTILLPTPVVDVDQLREVLPESDFRPMPVGSASLVASPAAVSAGTSATHTANDSLRELISAHPLWLMLDLIRKDIAQVKQLLQDIQKQWKPSAVLPEPRNQDPLTDEDYIPTFEEMEKILIERALKKFGGKKKDAAQALGISERTLFRKIKQYNINA